jgi:hypothetical protein
MSYGSGNYGCAEPARLDAALCSAPIMPAKKSFLCSLTHDRTHELWHRIIGDAPHLLDLDDLDHCYSAEDGQQPGLCHVLLNFT